MATRQNLTPIDEEDQRADGIRQLAEEVKLVLQMDEDTIDSSTLNPALSTFYGELGLSDDTDTNVQVLFLAEGDKGPESHIWRGHPDEYDIPALAAQYGTGSYRVKVYVRHPVQGGRVLRANKVIFWRLTKTQQDLLNRSKLPELDTRATVADAVAEAMRGILPLITQSHAPAQPQISAAEMMKNSIEMAKLMVQQAPPQQNPLEMMRAMAEMMAIMKPDTEPLANGTNAGTSDVILAMVNKFGPLFAGALAQNIGVPAEQQAIGQQSAMAAPVALTNQSDQSAQFQAAPATAVQGEDMNIAALAKLRMGITFLIGQCKAGGAPETYAEVVLDTVPAEAIQEILKQVDPYAWLESVSPAVKEHSEWFRALLAECKEILTSPGDNDAA